VHDAEIRSGLRVRVEAQHRDDPDTKIVDELGLRQGAVRVDLAVVNGVLKGYEIKSLADTLRRLPNQVKVYGEVLDLATIVLAEAHRQEASELIPDWWEVIVAVQASDRMRFELHREGAPNPNVDKRALTELLWRDEAVELLRLKDAHYGVLTKPRRLVWDRVAAVCELDEIRLAVRERIKARATPRPAS
jgi:hypothetical protein